MSDTTTEFTPTDAPGTGEVGDPFYPDVFVQLSGNDGNAFAIMGSVRQALRRAGVSNENIALYSADSQSGDYDHLLQTAMRWVEVG